MNASVTIDFADLEGIKKRAETAEAEVARLKGEVDQARLGDGGSDARRLATAFDLALEVVQFAIANLHPMAVRGWPYEALRALGELAPHLPGVNTSFREVATGDWRLLTKEMEKWEKARAEGREQELLAEENAARRPGPDHPIFSGGM
jgi:hypothetical protein